MSELDNVSSTGIDVMGLVLQKRTPSYPALGNQTITAQMLMNGLVITPITSSPFVWTLDTGKNIYEALKSPRIGSSFTTLISNNNNAENATMMIRFGEGLNGQLREDVLRHNSSMIIHFVVTGVNQVICFS